MRTKNNKLGDFIIQNRNKKSSYTYYKPVFLMETFNNPFNYISNPKTLLLLDKANTLLAKLDIESRNIPLPDSIIKISEKIEATESTKIEGGKTSVEDLYLADPQDEEKKDEIQETNNYINALREGLKKLEELPISTRYIKGLHELLMKDVRGQNKYPGEIRTTQNWIGGASLESAHFIPPHQDYVNELLGDWEKFLHSNSIDVPALIKIAILHYQFETIHPFIDGNGRIGRLLIQLCLIEKEIISTPILHISNFFENNRRSYYDYLDKVRYENDIESWILFFLDGVINTAENSLSIIKNITLSIEKARQKLEEKYQKITTTEVDLINFLVGNKLTTIKLLEMSFQIDFNRKIDYRRLVRLLKKFEECGLVEDYGHKLRKQKIFKSLIYPEYSA